MKTPALDELVNPNNWELEEQFMDGASLGYCEAFYVGDPVYKDAMKELKKLKDLQKAVVDFVEGNSIEQYKDAFNRMKGIVGI